MTRPICQMAAEARARHIVLKAIEKAGKSPVLELPMGMPYRSTLENTKADHILLCYILGEMTGHSMA